MGVRRRTVAEEELEEELESGGGGDAAESESFENDAELARFLDGINDAEASITAYRRPQGSRRLVFLFTRGVREVTMPEILESLRDDYGGGSFRLEIRDHRGMWVTAKGVEVEAPKRPLPGRELETREREVVHQVAPAPAADLSGVLELIERSNQQHRELINSLLAAMRPPEPRGVTELVEGLAALQALQPKPAPGLQIKEFLEVYQLIESIRGDGGGGSTGWDLMRSALNAFGPMLAGALPSAGALPRVTVGDAAAPVPATLPSPSPSSSPVPAGDGAGAVELAGTMQQQLELLLRAAEQDCDPTTYANLALDLLGTELAYRVFVEPAGWQMFLARVPQAGQEPLAAWFAEWRATLGELVHQEMQEESGGVSTNGHTETHADAGDADGTTSGAGGHPANAAHHGAPGGGG